MNVPFLDLAAQYRTIRTNIDAGIARVIEKTTFAGGPEVEAFEREFAAYCAVPHCVGVSSGTAALELLLRAYEIGPGAEVIVPTHTFFATAEAVSLTGATPVFVDVLDGSALLDPRTLTQAITPRTRAIIPVHLYGQPADMDAILTIARRGKIPVIEDACQAHGARYGGKRVGSLADAAAFSFYPGKNLGAYGEAGAVTTGDATIADRVRLLREHGSKIKYEHIAVGRNDRMDGMQGAVLRAKLPHLDAWNATRRGLAKRYREQLADVPSVRWIEEDAGREHVYHLCVIRLHDRDRARQTLGRRGIGTGVHYPIPLHLQQVYASLGHRRGDFPVAEKICDEILSLPMFPEMTEAQQDAVVEALRDLA